LLWRLHRLVQARRINTVDFRLPLSLISLCIAPNLLPACHLFAHRSQ